MGVALDTELNREVALKEIRPQFAHDHGSRVRFLLEAEVTGRLEHPGVVPVYGLGTDAAGRPYYAMRFIRGDSLKQAIERFHAADARPGGDRSEKALALRAAQPLRDGLQRCGIRPQPGRDPSRFEAGECHARPVRRDLGRGLGIGQGRRTRRPGGFERRNLASIVGGGLRLERDSGRHGDRHPLVHEPGTGRGAALRRRAGQRRLQPGMHSLLPADRPCADRG